MTGINIFEREEVSTHHTTQSVWVIFKDKGCVLLITVYDITEFLESHPGGDELLLQYGGKDITDIMSDPKEHTHSDSAYDMLQEYYIGNLNVSQTETVLEPKTKPFIDISRPMLWQVWTGNFSKEYYMEQVHIPKHSKTSPPLFGSPFLEVFSKTTWWFIPIFWAPIITYCMNQCLKQQSAETLIYLYSAGIFLWTFIEYALHRFLFHIDDLMPDHSAALTLHFLLHGIHHYVPMDRLRLVMPPALGFTLALPIWCFLTLALPYGIGQGVVSGAFTGFVLYDMMHYYTHHGKPVSNYLKKMKTYHLDHHYKNANLGFGITSKFWDHIFGTKLY